MKLTVLVDNNTFIDQYFRGEPAVSYYIEAEGKKILFDAGYSDAFIQNAERMNIPLWGIGYLILSHGHLDHTRGLPHLIKYFSEVGKAKEEKPLLIAHPEVFSSRILKNDDEIGPNVSPGDLAESFEIKLTEDPFFLTENLVFLGEVPRITSFEAQKPIGEVRTSDGLKADFIFDDSALACKTSQGIVVVTGCSHSGICNIIDYAREILNERRVIDIIGGFHLLNPAKEQMQGTQDYFRELSPRAVHACHCTDLRSKFALSQVADLSEVGVGLTLKFKD